MRRRLAFAIGVIWALFQLYTAAAGFYPALIQRSLHVAFAVSLAFLLFPSPGPTGKGRRSVSLLDYPCAALALATGAYFLLLYQRFTTRIQFVDSVYLSDLVVGLFSLLLLLEACRRVVGWALPVVALLAIAYQFLGPWSPGLLRHTGTSLTDFVDLQVLSLQGIYGVPTGVATDYIFYFVIFAAFLNISGGGQLFIDLATRLTGRTRGGPAKAAIVASSIMGSVNGSAVANVASTGIFTIPLMKRNGLPADLAGAVEAVSSTGGQLMPPVMGAAAFILAELVTVPYLSVVKAALIPALAYYAALYWMLDLHARRSGLRPTRPGLDSAAHIWLRIHLLLPLLVLIYFIIRASSLQRAACAAILAVVLAACLRKETRISFRRLVGGLADGAQQAITVSLPCATAGVLIGVIGYTGIGLRLSHLIIDLSGGLVVVALLLIMAGTIVFGMGMPTSGAYITAAVLLAPALVRLGISAMAAHLFIFYFAALSMVTPPVGLASYAAAGISGSSTGQTSLQAFRLALAGFLVPFAFVFNPVLLMEGALSEILWFSASLLLGIGALGVSIVGFLGTRFSRLERLLLFAAALLLIAPEHFTDLAGLLLAAAVAMHHRRANRRAPAALGHKNS